MRFLRPRHNFVQQFSRRASCALLTFTSGELFIILQKKKKKAELDLQNTDYEDTYQPMNTYANTNQMSTVILTYFSFYIEIKRERQREKTLVDDKIERSNRICDN